jgi:hypothetical protein
MPSIRECRVYLWLDKNIPFYVGIGSVKRSKCRRHNKQAEGRRRKAEINQTFKIEYVFVGSRTSCSDIESFLISSYGSVTSGGILFNFTPGGDGGVSSSMLPEDSLKRMIRGCKRGGETTHLRHPGITKDRCRTLGEKHGKKNGKVGAAKTRKAVVCVETGVEYVSAGKASEDTGVPRCSISKCCTGSLGTAGGFHWSFKESHGN